VRKYGRYHPIGFAMCVSLCVVFCCCLICRASVADYVPFPIGTWVIAISFVVPLVAWGLTLCILKNKYSGKNKPVPHYKYKKPIKMEDRAVAMFFPWIGGDIAAAIACFVMFAIGYKPALVMGIVFLVVAGLSVLVYKFVDKYWHNL